MNGNWLAPANNILLSDRAVTRPVRLVIFLNP